MSSATDVSFHLGLALMGYAYGDAFYAGLMLASSALAMAALASGGNDE